VNKPWVAAIMSILAIIAFTIAGIALAEEMIHSIWWTDPDWEQTWVKLESKEPITAVFTGTLQVRRPGSGEVIFSQDIDTSCVPTEDGPGTGRCGSLEYTINTDDFHSEDLELWSRACWMVTGYAEPLCMIYVPDNCDLAGVGCSISLIGTEVTIPEICRLAIERCETVQDDQGFWCIRTFRGTKPYDIYLPLIVIRR